MKKRIITMYTLILYLNGDNFSCHFVSLSSDQLLVQRNKFVINSVCSEHDVSISELDASGTSWLQDATSRVLKGIGGMRGRWDEGEEG